MSGIEPRQFIPKPVTILTENHTLIISVIMMRSQDDRTGLTKQIERNNEPKRQLTTQEGVSKSFRTESITKQKTTTTTITNTR